MQNRKEIETRFKKEKKVKYPITCELCVIHNNRKIRDLFDATGEDCLSSGGRYLYGKERYRYKEVVAMEGQSVIRLAMDKQNRNQVIIKIFKTQQEWITETTAYRRLPQYHPNIPTVYHYGPWENGDYYIAMEYLVGDTLLDFINDLPGRMNEYTARYIFRQVLNIVEVCHSNGVCHRDIKCENIMIVPVRQKHRDRHEEREFDFVVKLIDFGCSYTTKTNDMHRMPTHADRKFEMTGKYGSPLTISPEMIVGNTHTSMVDVWGLGLMLYCCLFGTLPFDNIPMEKFLSKNNDTMMIDHSPTISITVEPQAVITYEARHLLQNLLHFDPSKRLTIKQIKQHWWMNEARNEKW